MSHTRRRRVLILTIDAGSCHRVAAEMLARKLGRDPSLEPMVINYEHHDRLVWFASRLYDFLAARSVWAVNRLYTPLAWNFAPGHSALDRLLSRYANRCLDRLVARERPDLVVWTYAPGHVVTRCPVPSLVTVLDWRGGGSPDWAVGFATHIWCPSARNAEYLLETGRIAPQQIIMGDPIIAAHTRAPVAKDALRQALGLDPERPLVLFNTGRRAVGLDALAWNGPGAERLQVAVLCYRRPHLIRRVRALQRHTAMRLIPISWTDVVDDYLAASDLVITKPGAGMTMGALLRQCNVLFNCLEGVMTQEQETLDHLVDNSIATAAHSRADIVDHLAGLAVGRIVGPPPGMARLNLRNGLDDLCALVRRMALESKSETDSNRGVYRVE